MKGVAVATTTVKEVKAEIIVCFHFPLNSTLPLMQYRKMSFVSLHNVKPCFLSFFPDLAHHNYQVLFNFSLNSNLI
jgi:hypothetical protein